MRFLGSGVAKLALLRLPVVVLTGLGALGFAAGVLVGGAGSSPPLRARISEGPPIQMSPPPPSSPSVWDIPAGLAGLVEVPRDNAADPKRVLVPGCTLSEYEARKRELSDLRARAEDHKSDLAKTFAELRLALERPCLRHVSAMSPIPPDASRLRHQALFEFLYDLPEAMTIQMDGKGMLAYIPSDLALELAPAARAKLAPFLCKGDGAACGNTRDYQTRAEQTLRASYESELADRREREEESTLRYGERAFAPTLCSAAYASASFDAWAACAASRIPRQMSQFSSDIFVEKPRYRPVVRGWLTVISHDREDTSLAAYDLATGAFYSSETGGSCDSTSTLQRTGRVSLEALRELAFAVVNRPALQARRPYGSYARIPQGVVLKAGDPSDSKTPAEAVGADTSGAATYRYVDGPLDIEGFFSPWALGPDYHFNALWRVVQASELPGCAPAPLPPSEQLTFQSLLFEYDSSAHQPPPLGNWQRQLDDTKPLLEALRSQRCLGNKLESKWR